MYHTTLPLPKGGAFSLLFIDDFEGRPLFRSQADLVNELLKHPESDFHTDPSNREEYIKAVSRLRAFVSQLFSEHSKRSLTYEFRRSMAIILKEKSQRQLFDVSTVLDQIFSDLKDRNIARRNTALVVKKEPDKYMELVQELLHASSITVFTAHEIDIELMVMGQKTSINAFLVEDLLFSLMHKKSIKKYHFNFPLEQTCILFWKGLREELNRLIATHTHLICSIMEILKSVALYKEGDIDQAHPFPETKESIVSTKLLLYLSKKNYINVYHLQAPVYIASVISFELQQHNSSSYLCLRSDAGEDQLYKLSQRETFLSKLFVWDNLKLSGQGCPIHFQASF